MFVRYLYISGTVFYHVCDLQITPPSPKLIFSFVVAVFQKAEILNFGGLIYQFFILCIMLLVFYLRNICQENIPLDSRGRNKQVWGPQLLLLRGTPRAQSGFFFLMGPDLQGDLHPGVQAPCPEDHPGISREPRGCKPLTLSSGPDGSRGQSPAQREASLPVGAMRKALGFSGCLQLCSAPQAAHMLHPHAPSSQPSRQTHFGGK